MSRYVSSWLCHDISRDTRCIVSPLPIKQHFRCVPKYEDVIKWKHFPRYWPFVRGIHRSSVNSPHKGQRRGAFMFSVICAWINRWVNNREIGDLRRYRAHYDVTVMISTGLACLFLFDCTSPKYIMEWYFFLIKSHSTFVFSLIWETHLSKYKLNLMCDVNVISTTTIADLFAKKTAFHIGVY